ncbi:Protein of unknown function [Litoreibacter ascidiaceicola]|uniref:DUF3445 domain-containing protein n=1 Tax=Litoreibacter ascidiaceicola TaxID=1486859 RepID=A0A1M4VN53_9RHOB|nr:DUF3445 domain-containing protein [Litoreibacter ascidiaceicola]SHE70521.1 Protein of unknown function [Litoreibacter ascidiaceicola]
MVKGNMDPILQSHLPFAPWLDPRARRLPGVMPLTYDDWLKVDDAYAAQLAYKAKLMAERRDAVLMVDPSCLEAARELLKVALGNLPHGFGAGDVITCPDGRTVVPDFKAPFETLSTLFQEDFVILQKQGDAHVLSGALLCFPASWSLAEKFNKPLTAIHDPVAEYGDSIARSVERMFTAIRAEQPLMRSNALVYADPDLHHPHRGSDKLRDAGQAGFIRSERQCMVRLPETQAVVFSIHTYLVREADLTPEQAVGLLTHPITREEAIS